MSLCLKVPYVFVHLFALAITTEYLIILFIYPYKGPILVHLPSDQTQLKDRTAGISTTKQDYSIDLKLIY